MIYIVTGLGYGDEGKGSTVDFLSRQGDSIIIRHNGGSQAGHNVVLPDGTHHEFSRFGSGTFAGAKTYLSRFMLINPLDQRNEWKHLHDLGERELWQRMFVDEEARIITPWHVAVNRQRENARGDKRHGSCGRGIGELMSQDLAAPEYTIRVKDLRRHGIKTKLSNIRDYLRVSAYQINDNVDIVFRGSELIDRLAEDYHWWVSQVNVVDQWWLRKFSDHNLIFEGAQGVLLDQWYGFYPYTTWSTTTHQNAFYILEEAGFGESVPVTRLGITRAYMTRHGAGPFVTEFKNNESRGNEPHNHTGLWQGEFCQGHIDILALKYAVEVCGGIDGLVVTFLDQVSRPQPCGRYKLITDSGITWVEKIRTYPDHDLEAHGRLTEKLMTARPDYSFGRINHEQLFRVLEKRLDAPIYITSHGPTHADKQWVRKEALV